MIAFMNRYLFPLPLRVDLGLRSVCKYDNPFIYMVVKCTYLHANM